MNPRVHRRKRLYSQICLSIRHASLPAADAFALAGVYITAAGRCAPPGNKPAHVELERCREYLVRELKALPNVRVRLALGKIGFDAIVKARRELGHPEVT